MNNNTKIILSAVILVAVVSLLFIVVPITGAFIVSYIFALIAIAGLAVSLCTFGKNITKAPQGYSFIYTAVIYTLISVVFSVIACIAKLSVPITLIVHVAVLAVCIIITIALTSGSEYINKTEAKAEEKHKEFQKEKADYWK